MDRSGIGSGHWSHVNGTRHLAFAEGRRAGAIDPAPTAR